MDSLSNLHDHNNNPLGQVLILKLILEAVGKTDINDLLSCRLVSHTWNRVAVKLLEQQQLLEQKQGYALQLDYKKLLKFQSLLWTSRMSRRMNSSGRQELESLRLSLALSPKKCSDHCSELALCAQLLALHPHLRLAFLFIEIEYGVNVQAGEQPTQPNQRSWQSLVNLELFILLQLASADLLQLEIRNGDQQNPSPFEKFEFGSYLNLEFPRLTSLCYLVGEPFTTEPELSDLANHAVHIIKKAPKLTKLHLNVLNGFHSARSILECCSSNLEKLVLVINEVGLIELLSEIKFPKLKLFEAKDVFSTRTLNEFVQLNCPSLTQISLKLDDSFEFSENLLNSAALLLPNLPNILHFAMDSFYDTSPQFTELIRALFCKLFPKFTPLKCLTLDLGILFMFGTHLKESGHLVPPPDQYPVFPTISTLRIKIAFVEPEMFDVLGMATTIYHHTFPNLKTLIIEPFQAIVDEERDQERAIEFLCFHPGIQNLEIYNYVQDWLDQPSILNHSFSGLKKLKLRGPPKGISEGPRLNFMELLTRFPALEFLQLGKACVSTTEIHGLRKLMKRFENPFAINHKRTH